MNKKLKILVLVFISYTATGQQQHLYTQFMFNKLALNPAFAGNDEYIHLNLTYRNQWVGLNGAPTTQQITFDLPITVQRIGLGLNMTRHTIGVSKLLTIENAFAYKIQLTSGVLSLGTQLSLRNFSSDFSDPAIVSIDNVNLDPAIEAQKRQMYIFNVGFGAYYRSELWYVGISLPRLMKTKIDYDNPSILSAEAQHVNFMGGIKFYITDELSLSPQIMLNWTQNSPMNLDLNLNVSVFEKYIAGITVRNGADNGRFAESIDFIFGAQINNEAMLGFAYDLGLSSLNAYHSGSVELVFQYRWLPRKKTEEYINPRFF